MKLPVFILLLALSLSFSSFMSCHTEGVKLSQDDRYRIDTLSARKTTDLASEMEKFCKDSTPFFKQRFVDSLLIVREQEILKQTANGF